MKNTIFFGNGLNLVSGSCPGWSDLLARISLTKTPVPPEIPYTMQYEAMILAEETGRYNRTAKGKSGSDGKESEIRAISEGAVKEKIAAEMKDMKSNPFYERLAKLGVENYITTNYDNTLRNTFEKIGCTYERDAGERVYSLRRCCRIKKNGKPLSAIWNMHGEIDAPRTVMLGLDHYCGSVGRLDAYIKKPFEFEGKTIDSLITRLKKGKLPAAVSWADLFFTTDVHMLGFGLDYSETDLWWILDKRRRMLRSYGPQIARNKIYFYGHLTTDKEYMLAKFGVCYEKITLRNNNYQEQYTHIFSELEKRISL